MTQTSMESKIITILKQGWINLDQMYFIQTHGCFWYWRQDELKIEQLHCEWEREKRREGEWERERERGRKGEVKAFFWQSGNDKCFLGLLSTYAIR